MPGLPAQSESASGAATKDLNRDSVVGLEDTEERNGGAKSSESNTTSDHHPLKVLKSGSQSLVDNSDNNGEGSGGAVRLLDNARREPQVSSNKSTNEANGNFKSGSKSNGVTKQHMTKDTIITATTSAAPTTASTTTTAPLQQQQLSVSDSTTSTIIPLEPTNTEIIPKINGSAAAASKPKVNGTSAQHRNRTVVGNGLVQNDSSARLVSQDYLANLEDEDLDEEELRRGQSEEDLEDQVNGIRQKAKEHNGIFQVQDLDHPFTPDLGGDSKNLLIPSSSSGSPSKDSSSASAGGSNDQNKEERAANGGVNRKRSLSPFSNRENGGVFKMSHREWITVAILCFVNLINYMDRYTVAGVLEKIKCDFKMSNGEAGLLQTAFVVSYMIFAPIFGYLGDRYSRKYLMAAGVVLWSVTTLIGSFCNDFSSFIAFRALVGIGEASYSTIAPTIISDLFVDDRRSTMLTLFYFAIPVGSGLGYIVGSETANLAAQSGAEMAWKWGLRVTPVMGIIAALLILFVMSEPSRGESENSHLHATSYKEDIIYLTKNRSFMYSTFGFTCVAFVTGALAWWGPIFITLGIQAQDPTQDGKNVSFIFGGIAMLSGIIGVPLGSFISQRYRSRIARADPLICAFGLIGSTPFLFGAAVLARYNSAATYVMIFCGELLLNLNWSIVADILLYVVIPTRRSTAEAFQILFSHALGDAGSPYLIGQISDWLKPTIGHTEGWVQPNNTDSLNGTDCNLSLITTDDVVLDFTSLQYSLYITTFVEVLGGLFFLITAWYVVEDKFRADKAIAGDDLIREGSEPAHFDADEPELHSSE